ncbi:hypothetical protein ABZP26_17570 [Pseudoalteromonas sp. SD03]|uniref:HNH endonuclease n=1 Tax=Pseudoalteromonas sp. SD03 TaxID=3231719 RepID=A0AB39AW71_9GAMM
MDKRIDFTEATKNKVRFAAGNLCSMKGCYVDCRSGALNIATISHIIPARPNGPRGNEKIYNEEFIKDESNAIHLCNICETVIDANADMYPADDLRKLKFVREYGQNVKVHLLQRKMKNIRTDYLSEVITKKVDEIGSLEEASKHLNSLVQMEIVADEVKIKHKMLMDKEVFDEAKKLFTPAALLNPSLCNLQNYLNSQRTKTEAEYTIDDWKKDSFRLEHYLPNYNKNKNIIAELGGEIVSLADKKIILSNYPVKLISLAPPNYKEYCFIRMFTHPFIKIKLRLSQRMNELKGNYNSIKIKVEGNNSNPFQAISKKDINELIQLFTLLKGGNKVGFRLGNESTGYVNTKIIPIKFESDTLAIDEIIKQLEKLAIFYEGAYRFESFVHQDSIINFDHNSIDKILPILEWFKIEYERDPAKVDYDDESRKAKVSVVKGPYQKVKEDSGFVTTYPIIKIELY